MSEGESVKVAVRVRPFNQREKDRNARLIIRMEGKNTWITNPENNEEKMFTFDYSYWSHESVDPTFATQTTVFNDLGISVLDQAFAGYNVSLFAYGQTGSGKSYSVVGYGQEKGIVPRACEELFKRIEGNTNPDMSYKVEASMMEIYNEQVRDLFNPKGAKPGGLKVRENPKTGPYVEDLALLPVKDFREITNLMDEGTLARTVASTNMNATSSRAHTIFTIIFTQTMRDTVVNKETQKVSKVSLVDLAGSERAESTGATGDRLKEGANINKSLSALGNCISALAENCSGAKGAKKKFVPYRDSTLTWLLKESLGGNAKTIMIAALSPADINYDETLSTLRYADRAKQIKNAAVVNEDPNAKLIRELRAEIELLRSQIDPSKKAASQPGSAGESDEVRRLREQFEESQKLIAMLTMSDDEKRLQSDAINASRESALRVAGFGNGTKQTTPFMSNLNEDPQLSESIIYFFEEGKRILFGKKNVPGVDVPLSGLSIAKEHCTFENQGGTVKLSPFSNARCFINGKQIAAPQTLAANDRVILGNNHLFRFCLPNVAENTSMDWDYAQKEFAEAQGNSVTIQEESEGMKLLEDERRKQQAELDSQRRQLEELQKKMSLGNNEELERKNKELEEALRKQEQLAAELTMRKEREQRERSLLEDALLKAIPMVNEANQLAEELKKEVRFEIKLLAVIQKVADMSLPEELRYQKSTEVRVRTMGNNWTLDKFFNRVYLMREVYQNYMEAVENNTEYHCSEQDDPFYDPVDYQQVGTAMVYLTSLSHLLETELSTPILDYKGKPEGELMVEIVPVEYDDIEDVRELLGKKMSFTVKIPYARGLPQNVCSNVFVRFKFFTDDTVYETEKATKKSINPTIDYKREFIVNPVTEEFIKYLEQEAVQFEVFGSSDEASSADASGKNGGGIHYVPGSGGGNGDGLPSSSSSSSAAGGASAAGMVVGAAAGAAVPAGQDKSTVENVKVLSRQVDELRDMLKSQQAETQKKVKDFENLLQQKEAEIKRLQDEAAKQQRQQQKKSKACLLM